MEETEEILCVICDKPITGDFAVEEYNSMKVWIHPHHPRPKREIK